MIKTFTFMVMHFSIAFSVVYMMTGSLVIGGAVALVEPMVNSLAYHFHEKIWERIRANKALQQDKAKPEVYAV